MKVLTIYIYTIQLTLTLPNPIQNCNCTAHTGNSHISSLEVIIIFHLHTFQSLAMLLDMWRGQMQKIRNLHQFSIAKFAWRQAIVLTPTFNVTLAYWQRHGILFKNARCRPGICPVLIGRHAIVSCHIVFISPDVLYKK